MRLKKKIPKIDTAVLARIRDGPTKPLKSSVKPLKSSRKGFLKGKNEGYTYADLLQKNLNKKEPTREDLERSVEGYIRFLIRYRELRKLKPLSKEKLDTFRLEWRKLHGI